MSIGKDMANDRGKHLGMSLPRRWISDMLYFAKSVPLVAAERNLRLKTLVDLRRSMANPPSWSSMMIRAMSLVSQRFPEMRRSYMPYPWPYFYESSFSVASIVFTREFRDELATFLVPMLHPERRTLSEIQEKVQSWKDDPIEAHGALRRIVRNSKPPWPIRRFLWWFGLRWLGMLRARYFGTFAINSIAGTRSRMLQFQSPLTTVLYYGSVDKHGEMTIQFAFDHRVFDGNTAGKILSELEQVLNQEMVAELQELKILATNSQSDVLRSQHISNASKLSEQT